jgi:hypothetical protein
MRDKACASALPRLSRLGRLTAAGLAAALVAAILPVALPTAAAELEAPLLRIHVTSTVDRLLSFSEIDWEVLITASGNMQGFTTCGCTGPECVMQRWIAVANTAQLSLSQLSTLQAALASGHIGLLGSCDYLDGGLASDQGLYELHWYGRNLRQNTIVLHLGPDYSPGAHPSCSQAEIDLFTTIDRLVVNVLGFPSTIAPGPHNRATACGEVQ